MAIVPDPGRRRQKSDLRSQPGLRSEDCLLVLAVACLPLDLHQIRSVLGISSDAEIERALKPALKAGRVSRLPSGQVCLESSQVHALLSQAPARLEAIGEACHRVLKLNAHTLQRLDSYLGRPDFYRLPRDLREPAYVSRVRVNGWLQLRSDKFVEGCLERLGMTDEEIMARGEVVFARGWRFQAPGRTPQAWPLVAAGDLEAALAILERGDPGRSLPYLSEVFYSLCLLRLQPEQAVCRLSQGGSDSMILDFLRSAALERCPDCTLTGPVTIADLFLGLATWWTAPERLVSQYDRLQEGAEKAEAAGFVFWARQFRSLLSRCGQGPAESGWSLADLLPHRHGLTWTLHEDFLTVAGPPRGLTVGERAALLYRDLRALGGLIGHPRVYCARTRKRLLVEACCTQLHIRPWGKGRYRLTLSADAPRRSGERVAYCEPLPQRGELEKLLAGLSALRKDDFLFLSVAQAVAEHVPVVSCLDREGVEPDCRARLLLTPTPTGYRAELRVRPLGEGTLPVWAGLGSLDWGNFQRRTQRNLELELELAQQFRGRLQSLLSVFESAWEWSLNHDECLQLLDGLEAWPESIVEWPDSSRARRRSAKVMASSGSQGSITLEGQIPANPMLQARLAAVVQLVSDGPNRYVRRSSLSQELRREMETETAVAEPFCDEKWPSVDWRAAFQRLEEAQSWSPDLPEIVLANPRPYQLHGFRWLARLGRAGLGACLADDMGLGKTLQVLSVLALRAPEGPALVVAPTSVTRNWLREGARYVPRLSLRLIQELDRPLDSLGPGDVLVVSYSRLVEAVATLSALRWNTVVLDESQAIKNFQSQRARAVYRLRGAFHIAVSGTPIENHLGELWSLMRFLNPALLGGWQEFRQHFQVPVEEGDAGRRAQLTTLIEPFFLRRTKAEVLPELPEKQTEVLYLELPRGERELYEMLRQQALNELQGAGLNRRRVWYYLLKLRQLCCHPALVYPQMDFPGARLEFCARLLDDLEQSGHRCLVYSHFPTLLRRLAKLLDARGIGYEYLDGSTPEWLRQEAVDRFQAKSAPVFLISRKAGGTGLNLTVADHVFHLDPWWNPAVEDQASDRAHRLGQSGQVTVYRFIAPGTVEEEILRLQDWKRELAECLLGGPSDRARVTTAQLLDMLHSASEFGPGALSSQPALPDIRPPGDTLSITEAAELAGCSRGSIYLALRKRALVGYKQGQEWRIPRDRLTEWKQERYPRLEEMDRSAGYTSAEFTRIYGLKRGDANRAINLGRLKATKVTGSRAEYVFWISKEDGEAWLAELRRGEEVALRGEVLKVTEAAARVGVTPTCLRVAIGKQRLPARRVVSGYLVGLQDVEAYLNREYRSPDRAWTLKRTVAVVGWSDSFFANVMKTGRLTGRLVKGSDSKARLEFDADSLANWLRAECPPYCPEVAHLSVLLSPEEAARESGLSEETIRSAMADDSLRALGEILTRCEFDRWLESLGRAPSRDPAGAPFLNLGQAAELTGFRPRDIAHALNRGPLKVHWREGAGMKIRLIERMDLLQWAARRRATPERPSLTTRQITERYPLSKSDIKTAIQCGNLEASHIGKACFVPIDALEAWLERREAQRTFNLTAIARRLGVPNTALLAAVNKGEIRATKAANGRTWLLEWTSVQAWHSSRAPEEDWITIPDATRRFGITAARMYGAISSGHLERRTNPVRVHLPGLEEHYRRYWA